jgi:hypothetical protein
MWASQGNMQRMAQGIKWRVIKKSGVLFFAKSKTGKELATLV